MNDLQKMAQEKSVLQWGGLAGEQTLKCYLRCYLRCYFGVLLYTAGARNLLLTGREGGIEGC